MIDSLKGHMINDVQFSGRNCPQGYHEYKDSQPEGSNFDSASTRRRRYFKIDVFAPEFTPPISTHARPNFLFGN